MQTIFNRGYDSEVAAAAAHAPKEILVFGGVRSQQAPIGSDHIYPNDVIHGESILGVEVSKAAAERKARNAGGRDHAQRGGKTEGLRLAIEFAQLEAGFGAH